MVLDIGLLNPVRSQRKYIKKLQNATKRYLEEMFTIVHCVPTFLLSTTEDIKGRPFPWEGLSGREIK